MKRQPVPRRRIYDMYWSFASERHRAFERRVRGLPPPWSDDPILQTFKFCNVFRAADRVSQCLIKDVAYGSHDGAVEDLLFQIAAFRIFSRIETWLEVVRFLGRPPSLTDLRSGSFTRALEHAKELNGRLYTGAFILCATDAYGQRKKHLNHVELLRHMFLRDKLASRLLWATSLRQLYELLHSFPLIGDFMAYQLAIDLNYADCFRFSENDFTKPGPGALRGITKVFEGLGDYSPEEAILWMVDRQEDSWSRLGLTFGGLFGRPLHAIDCQGLFCEVDKYCRQAAPELTSARKRIKARFAPSPASMRLFFPPKWGLNDRVPRDPVLGEAWSVEKETSLSSLSACTERGLRDEASFRQPAWPRRLPTRGPLRWR